MKLRTIIFIIILAVIVLAVAGIWTGKSYLGSLFGNKEPGELITAENKANPEDFSKLDIEWAAGSVKIETADTTQITVKETRDSNNPHALVTEFDGDTLKIRYAESLSVNLGALSSKDLTITVPKDWVCQDLEIDGAALNISISGLNTRSMELKGAAAKLTYTGIISELECDGAASQINLNCTEAPKYIDINGAACKLTMTLPKGSGFAVETDGVALDFESNCTTSFNDGTYTYGDGSCKVKIAGLGCSVTVNAQ